MKQNDTKADEITLNPGEANFKAMAFAIPTLLLFGVPFFIFWEPHLGSNTLLTTIYSIYTLPLLVGGILAHELIHGIFWSRYTRNGSDAISFGIKWTFLTPYCHCSEPLKAGQYRVGIIMPAILLGFIPSVAALITGSMGALIFGLFFTMAAGGDFLMMALLRQIRKNDLVQDHPSKIGCVVYRQS